MTGRKKSDKGNDETAPQVPLKPGQNYGRTELESMSLRSTIGVLHLRGMTTQEIADELGISKQAVTRHLKRIKDMYKEQQIEQGMIMLSRELQFIVFARDQALAEWEESKAPKEKEVLSSEGNAHRGDDEDGDDDPGKPRKVKLLERFEREGRLGDPRYLTIVIDSTEKIIRILGLGKPTTIDITTNGKELQQEVRQLSDGQLEALLVKLLEKVGDKDALREIMELADGGADEG